ncbi:MAG: hypothetical protein MJ172_03055 [Clostridia bacterium]|nr:hypothetical protein [Clostridia bacterium]
MHKLNRLHRKKFFWPAVAGAFFFLLLSIVSCYYFLGKDFMNFITCTKSVSTVDIDNYKEEQFIRFNATSLEGVYEVYREEGAYSYIMPFEDKDGNTKYIGLYLKGDMLEKADRLMETGKGGPIKGCGMVWDLNSMECGWFEETLEIEGIDYTSDQIVPKFIVYLPLSSFGGFDLFGALIAPIGFLLGAIYFFVGAIKRFSNKDMINYLTEKRIDPEQFAEDVLNGEEYAGVMIGKRYALAMSPKNVGTIIYSELDKVYNEFRWVKGNDAVKRQDRVVFVNKDKSSASVVVDSEYAAKSLMEKIEALVPDVTKEKEATKLQDVEVQDIDNYMVHSSNIKRR